MKIGIDIDGVLIDTRRFFLDYGTKFCVENNIKYEINPSAYNLKEIFNFENKEHNDIFYKYLDDYYKNIKASTFASKVIKKLKKDENEIYIITARQLANIDTLEGEKARNIVKEWLLNNDIFYDKLIFSKKEDKLKWCREYKIDLMIEDNVQNINSISSLIPVICFDMPYNKVCKGKNIIRCYSWYDIYVKIKNK